MWSSSMDMVDDIVICQEGNMEDAGGDKPSSGSTSSEKIPDPVVYKLVRVDFDGKLVPATDDELMEVESLLEFDKGEVLSVSDFGGTEGLGTSKDETPEKPLMENYEGSLQINTEVGEEISQAHSEKAAASSLNNQQVNRSESMEEEPSLQDKFSKRVPPSFNPDFSWLKGEINLDNLTLRELQETFKATFGRETSSKDKMWLKRRIAMGLTNSCDVTVTRFVIRDGKLLKRCGELSKNADSEDPMTGEVCSSGDDVPVSCQNHFRDALLSVDLGNSLADSGHRSDDGDQGGVKRVRKPTKRYIEELSDNDTKDSSGKLSSAKRLVQDKTSSKTPVKIAGAIHSGGILTRSDSLGGHGIQVPYVSRIRRCRPRQSLMPLVKFQRANDAMRRTMCEDSVKQENPKHDNVRGDEISEVKSISYEEPLASEEKEKGSSTSMSYHSQGRGPESCNSLGDTQQDEVTGKCSENKNDVSGNSSEGNAGIEPTTKGAVRRKHHRAWTLTEVVKLVDGVTKFGAGRWSEIKRLSFASQSYRTSVDLKDKWRNLLKASFASPGPDKGTNHRKNAPSPIPAPILVKVRELAEINGQAPMIFRASSVNSGSSVNESDRSGYL